MPPVEVVEKVESRWNAGAEVGEKMCDHDHISFGTDDVLRPTHVWVDDPFAQNGVLEVRKVPRAEDSSLKDI